MHICEALRFTRRFGIITVLAVSSGRPKVASARSQLLPSFVSLIGFGLLRTLAQHDESRRRTTLRGHQRRDLLCTRTNLVLPVSLGRTFCRCGKRQHSHDVA